MSIALLKFTTVMHAKWGKGFFASVEKTAHLKITIELDDMTSNQNHNTTLFEGNISFIKFANNGHNIFSVSIDEANLIKRSFLKFMSELDSLGWNVTSVIDKVDEDEGSYFPTLFGLAGRDIGKPFVRYKEATIRKK